ncbi:hypothetical protein H2198_006744 [Neophaeococcomyces mojaviensis]|uniref:Uncharacterized protein n=1 Tax=Neophaeococcomyces mojaviensis TaxID=3383035 RepID=A0ACC3A2J4_9EURO|nr:hypothetical protein H2198_006744 [Knufia sp. JES_112]
MSFGLILLTGATGLVGFRILEEALDRGYKVRLAIRSESKIDQLKKALGSRYAAHDLEFVLVPDMGRDGAFDQAVQGVKHIIHVASPLPIPSEDLEASIIKPAVSVTLQILRAALKDKRRGVEKVVITSSVAAVSPSLPKAFDADNVEPDPQGPWAHPLLAYAASKKLSYNATRRFILEENPYFNIIHVMPSFVIGRNGYATKREDYTTGSNSIALAPLLGINIAQGRPGFACYVDDVASVHIAALRSDVQGHQSFGVNYDGLNGINWNDAIDIVKRKAPELVSNGLFSFNGSVVTQKVPFNTSKTEKQLGINFKSFEDMIIDVSRAYAAVG